MREKEIEKKFREGIQMIGGRCYKFVSPGNDGVPDRLVLLPGGSVIFVELKTETGRLSGLQRVQLRKMASLDCEVWVLKGLRDVEQFVKELRGGVADGVCTTCVSEQGYRFYSWT